MLVGNSGVEGGWSECRGMWHRLACSTVPARCDRMCADTPAALPWTRPPSPMRALSCVPLSREARESAAFRRLQGNGQGTRWPEQGVFKPVPPGLTLNHHCQGWRSAPPPHKPATTRVLLHLTSRADSGGKRPECGSRHVATHTWCCIETAPDGAQASGCPERAGVRGVASRRSQGLGNTRARTFS